MMKNKVCQLCMLGILPNDNYCRLTDYKEGKFFMENYYHNSCFKKRLEAGNELKEAKNIAFATLLKANKMMAKLEKDMES